MDVGMLVSRIGFTPLKGTRHVDHETVELSATGPEGDRVFCLVDRARARVLRTVENPTLVRAMSRWADGELAVEVGGRRTAGHPEPTGTRLAVDYWGRRAEVELVAGPWADAFSAHLGREVVLARSVRPGEVVYGGSVTLLTTAALADLGTRLGQEVDSARFRATFLIDTPADEDETAWAGRRLRVGSATLAVRGTVPRCAVVDLDPATGDRDAPVLSTLAGYRRGQQEVHFGVDAVVVEPGSVRVGDTAELERG
jgi:uncharacterized protein YcbX